jgi:hypothetical protein
VLEKPTVVQISTPRDALLIHLPMLVPISTGPADGIRMMNGHTVTHTGQKVGAVYSNVGFGFDRSRVPFHAAVDLLLVFKAFISPKEQRRVL